MTSPKFLADANAEESGAFVGPVKTDDWFAGALAHVYNELAIRPDYKNDFLESMRGVQNIMSPHMYGPQAMPLWKANIEDPDYYPFTSDGHIIADHADRIRQLTEGAEILIEQGMGDEHAIETKTMAVFDLIGAKRIIGIDFSDAALMAGTVAITSVRPDLAGKFKTLTRNFNKQPYKLNLPGKKVITQLGLTIGNNPDRDLTQLLKHYRDQMNEGDIFIFSVDRNLNKLSLYRAYNKTFGTWVDDMRRSNAEEFGKSTGYKPGDFEYIRYWDERQTSLHFGFRAVRDGHVMNGNERISYVKNQPFWYLPSRRYRQTALDEFYRKAGGFELMDVLPDRRNFVCWQVLKAVPRPAAP